MYITEEYLNGTYNSCKNVLLPSSGQHAIELMCGSFGAAKCNALRWFQHMGDDKIDGEPRIPFQINYLPQKNEITVNKIKPINPKVIPCSQSVDVSIN